MRVGLIGPLPPSLGGATPGGVATHQAHLAEGLSACPDLRVSLLATNASALPTPLPYHAVPLTAGSLLRPRALRYALPVASRREPGSRRELLANLVSYAEYLETTNPEVVHVQHPLERASHVRRVFELEGRRRPLVITAHSFFGEHPDDVIHTMMTSNLRAADKVIAVSPHIADQAAQLGVPRDRLHVIRSGIDIAQFQPRDRAAARSRLGLSRSTPLVLFVGNLEPRKQVDVLLHAFSMLSPLAVLVIVGTGESAGPDDQTHHLHRLTNDLGLTERVKFVGRVDDVTLLDWYAAADVFALPSSSEAQGIVALEAMACGLPVVASAVGGLLGTIDDGETGYLVPTGESEALARRLSDLLDDPACRARIGAAAREKVAHDFTWQRAVAATVDVYRELVPCPTG